MSTSNGKESSPQNSISSYDADVNFQTASSSVVCSIECDLRYSQLEERVGKLEQKLTDEQTQQIPKCAHQDVTDSQGHSSDDIDTCTTKFITNREQTTEVVIPFKLQATQSVQHSTPFFSDHDNSGYQMCIQMNRGDSSDPELTFSLVIMKSKQDDQLPWPFNRQITIELTNDGKGILTTIYPKSEKSFERPKYDLNKPFKFMCKRYNDLLSDGSISDDKIVFLVTVV